MSAIVGICHVDRRPVELTLLARMLDRLAARGPHGRGQWVSGSLGLGHRLLHTTPESLKESQPVSDAWGECRLVWDGRLDNREELISIFRRDNIPLGGETDPELVLRAYRKWNVDCFKRLLGDFALAIWDSRTHDLICARDPIGVKPVYYHWSGKRLTFASEVKALLEDQAIGRQPYEPAIADYLLMGCRDPESTPFEDIKQLRPGHYFHLHNGALSIHRYWELKPAPEIRYAREEEYLVQFRDLFREAVRCRLRSHVPIGVMLSGGIDSTAVTAMAETIRRGQLSPAPLTAFSYLNDGFFREEWHPIQALTEKYGTRIHTITQEWKDGPMTRFEVSVASSEILHHDGFLTLPFILTPIASNDVGILLMGFGADELLRNGELGFLQDLLRAGKVARLLAEIHSMGTAYDDNPRAILASLLWLQLPLGLRRRVKAVMGRQVPRWLEPSFAKRTGIAQWTMPASPRSFPNLCQEESARALTAPSLSLSLNWMDAATSAYSIECRHPFLDRRLIEFFLSIPSRVKVSHGYRKMFAQRALREVSAVPLRPREDATPYIPLMDVQVERERDTSLLQRHLFRPDALVFQYVDRAEAEHIRDRYLAGETRYRNLLWQFTNLERWLQEFFSRRKAPGRKEP